MAGTQAEKKEPNFLGWLIVICGAALFLRLGLEVVRWLFHVSTHRAPALAYFHSDNFKAIAIVTGFLLGVWIVASLVLLQKWQWKILLRWTAGLFLGGTIVVIFLAVLKWAWTTLSAQ